MDYFYPAECGNEIFSHMFSTAFSADMEFEIYDAIGAGINRRKTARRGVKINNIGRLLYLTSWKIFGRF